MKDRAFKVAEDLLCALITDDNKNVDRADEVKELYSSLLREERYREVLNLAVERMSEDQRGFYEKMIKRDQEDVRYYFLAGLPGTGKSYLQNALHLHFTMEDEAKETDSTRVTEFICLAPTNLIAFQQHGFTIHKALRSTCQRLKLSIAKIEDSLIKELVSAKLSTLPKLKSMAVPDLEDVIVEFYNKKILEEENVDRESMYSNYRGFLEDDCLNIKIILIDEGSMVSSILMALLSLQYPNCKFIVMYGPNQLPPVNGFPSCDEAFSPACKTYFHALKTQMRFDNECQEFNNFIAFFSDVLSGNVNQDDKLKMMKHYYQNITIGGNLEDYKSLVEDKILIVSTNKQRCEENEYRLYKEKGDGKIYSIPALYDTDRLKFFNVESNLGIDKVLKITVGVKCIVRCNDLYNGLIKGMIVEVVDIEEDSMGNVSVIVVKTSDDTLIQVSRYTFETNIPTQFVLQFPLALFYSITAHSTQGKTLDCKVGVSLKYHGVDILYKKSFFVAITRIRHPKQLFMDKHPVFFLEPYMSINSLRDIQEVDEKIHSVDFKKRKLDLPISNMYDVAELVNIVKTEKSMQ